MTLASKNHISFLWRLLCPLCPLFLANSIKGRYKKIRFWHAVKVVRRSKIPYQNIIFQFSILSTFIPSHESAKVAWIGSNQPGTFFCTLYAHSASEIRLLSSYKESVFLTNNTLANLSLNIAFPFSRQR